MIEVITSIPYELNACTCVSFIPVSMENNITILRLNSHLIALGRFNCFNMKLIHWRKDSKFALVSVVKLRINLHKFVTQKSSSVNNFFMNY